MIGQFLKARHDRIVGRDFVHAADDAEWRRTVGVEKEHIKDDCRGAHLIERVTSFASKVRGHGHCPNCSRLSSSISAMRTGVGS